MATLSAASGDWPRWNELSFYVPMLLGTDIEWDGKSFLRRIEKEFPWPTTAPPQFPEPLFCDHLGHKHFQDQLIVSALHLVAQSRFNLKSSERVADTSDLAADTQTG
jgi:hypothetical protein